jgi:hypothetical protein
MNPTSFESFQAFFQNYFILMVIVAIIFNGCLLFLAFRLVGAVVAWLEKKSK